MFSKCGFNNLSIYGSLDFPRGQPLTTCYLANAIPEQRYEIGMPYAMIIATEHCRLNKIQTPITCILEQHAFKYNKF